MWRVSRRWEARTFLQQFCKPHALHPLRERPLHVQRLPLLALRGVHRVCTSVRKESTPCEHVIPTKQLRRVAQVEGPEPRLLSCVAYQPVLLSAINNTHLLRLSLLKRTWIPSPAQLAYCVLRPGIQKPP
jgi:hypothetical protein